MSIRQYKKSMRRVVSGSKSDALGKSKPSPFGRSLALAPLGVLLSGIALASPQGGQVVGGTGSIAQPTSTQTIVNQQTQKMAIDWQSFNLAAGESVRFNQPSSSAAVLNRILDQNPSQIFGSIQANGRVFLANPNGIIFGESATINVGSFLATTLNTSVTDFMLGGTWTLGSEDLSAGGAIVNRGLIAAATGGSVTLVGGSVLNEGTIIATLGSVNLASGKVATLDFDGDGLLSFAVSGEVLENASNAASAVANTGSITADGGQVLLTGHAAKDVFAKVVNNEGIIQANSINTSGGTIRLVGGETDIVANSGTLRAKGDDSGEKGGTVQMLGEKVGLLDNGKIDVSGDAGGGTALIGGGYQGKNSAIRNSSVTYVGPNATIDASAMGIGDGGKVIVWADDTTEFYGNISARGGATSGNGGFAEVSGKQHLCVTGHADLQSTHGSAGTLLLDPGTVQIVVGVDGGETLFDTFTDGYINAQLASSNLIISTDDATNANGTDEDIIFIGSTSISWGAATSLTLNAGRNITLSGSISAISPSASLSLNFGQDNAGGILDISGATPLSVQNITANGGTGIDTITGFNADSTWNLGVTQTYSSGSTAISLAAIEVLQGGSAADQFTVSNATSANLLGGSGNDIFTINAALTGSVDGEAGANTLAGSQIANVTVSSSATDGYSGSLQTTANLSGGFSNIRTLNGSGSLTGENAASTWLLGATKTYEDASSNGVLTFSGFTTLQGGNAADQFTVNNATTANLLAGAGDDTFTINAALTGAVNGETGANTLAGSQIANVTVSSSATDGYSGSLQTTANLSGGFSNIRTLNGSGSLTGENAASTWLLGATKTYEDASSNGVLTFSGFTTLQGGNAADQFTVNNATTANLLAGAGDDTFTINAALTGSVDGEAGANTLAGSQIANVTVSSSATDGYSGSLQTTANLSGGFSNIRTLNGSGSLTGENAASTWLLGATKTYEDASSNGVLTFSGFTTLQGGNAADQFTVNNATTANLLAGAGDDTFTINAALTGSVDGEAGANTLAGSQIANVTVSSSATDGYSGSLQTTANLSGGFSNIRTLNGSGSLTGENAASTWLLGATKTYEDASSNGVLTFSGFTTLQGGTLADQFTVSNATSANLLGGSGNDIFTINAALTGSVDGEAGANTLAGSQIANVTVSSSATNGYSGSLLTTANLSGGFSNIRTLNGSGSLTGENAASTWLLGATKTYEDASSNGVLTFSGFTTLQGGNAADQFTVNNATTANLLAGAGDDTFTINAALTGAVNGETGANTLAGSQIANVTVSSSATDGYSGSLQTTANLSGGFSNIRTLNGSGSLTGENAASTWLLGATKTYEDASSNGVLTFSGFTTLQGGNAADQFTVNNATTANLLAGAGDDTFTINAALTGSVDGEAGNDTLNINSDSSIILLSSSSLQFDFQPLISVTNIEFTTLTGGGSDNTIDVSGLTTGVATIYLTAGTDTVIGNGTNTTLIGREQDSAWTLGATNTYNSSGGTTTFSGFTTLQGGTLADQFTVSNATSANLLGGSGNDIFTINAALTGSVDGEAGANTLAGSQIANVTVSSSATNGYSGSLLTTANLSGGFSNIRTLNGSGSLTGENAASTWLLGATKTYEDASSNGVLTFSGFTTLQGGNAADQFTVNNATTANLLAGAGDDTFTINAALTGAVNGETGANTLAGSQIANVTVSSSATDGYSGSLQTTANLSGGFSNIRTLNGSGSLTGENAASTWLLGATKTYEDASSNGVLTFSGFTTLQGGNAADQFTVNNATTANLLAGAGDDTFTINAALTGSVDGEAGANTLAGSQIANVTVSSSATDGYSGSLQTTANLSGGFSNIRTLNGSGSLTGENAASTWLLGATKTYEDASSNGVLTFSGFTTLQGGTLADQFTVSNATSANLLGGSGNDTFTINAALTGSVDGEAGANTLAGSQIANVTVSSSATDGYSGSLQTTANLSGGFSNIRTLNGSGSLTGENAASTWLLGATKTYEDASSNGVLTFSGFTTLQGGSEGDAFNLAVGVAYFDGMLNGGGGTNTLAATDGSNTWNINGANQGTLNGSAFTHIANLLGGSGDDTFVFATAGTLSGDLTGGSQITHDILNLSAKLGTVTINQQTQKATGIAGIFTLIEEVIGNGAGTTLTGSNSGQTFTLTGANAGKAGSLFFSGVANLIGGSGSDTYTGNGGSLSGTITDGAFTGDKTAFIEGGDGGSTTISGSLNVAGLYLNSTSLTINGDIDTGSGTVYLRAMNGNIDNMSTGHTLTTSGNLYLVTSSHTGTVKMNIEGGAKLYLNTWQPGTFYGEYILVENINKVPIINALFDALVGSEFGAHDSIDYFIDPALFDQSISLFSSSEPSVLLPEDQLEETLGKFYRWPAIRLAVLN